MFLGLGGWKIYKNKAMLYNSIRRHDVIVDYIKEAIFGGFIWVNGSVLEMSDLLLS
jgi:hypothetical protein